MRGRVAAKDAVRELLMERHELVAPLETVLILPDRSGQPVVSFADALCGVSAILISISHCGDSSVALAAESNGRTRGIGIDVASTADDHDGLVEGGFGGRERALLKDGLVMGNTELLLRLWCAKEAVGKALGVGLMGDPLNYRIAGVAANRIEVAVETAVARSRAPRSDSSGMVTALVGQGRGMTYAVARIGW
jgi:phosphopantetheinyl transferase